MCTSEVHLGRTVGWHVKFCHWLWEEEAAADTSYRDLSCHCMVRWDGEVFFICTYVGLMWSLLNDCLLLVVLVCFYFSQGHRVSDESLLQALSWQWGEGVGWSAFHHQLPFYYACLLKVQPIFSKVNINISIKECSWEYKRIQNHTSLDQSKISVCIFLFLYWNHWFSWNEFRLLLCFRQFFK